MYIVPNSKLWILKGVPLDTTYEHTILFPSPSIQTSYFTSKAKYQFQAQTYQRLNRGRMRVQQTADNLYDCNYLMFQNSAYGQKWFYAFIKTIEYVNDITSEIEYEIDVLQTWHFNYNLERCYIERQHSLQDTIGSNILPEPVELGEYVFNKTDNASKYEPIVTMNDLKFVIAVANVTDQTSGVSAHIYDSILQGCTLYAFKPTELQDLNEFLNTFVTGGHPDSIILIYVVPAILLPDASVSAETFEITDGTTGFINTYLKTALTGTEQLNGYTPKNKKLYTYPYNFYNVDDSNGNSLSLRYEFFDNNTPAVQIYGTITNPVLITLRPVNYKGIATGSVLGGYDTLNTESLQLSGYPQCSWVNDAYQAYVAQNNIPNFLNVIAPLAAGAITGNAFTLGTGIYSVISALRETYSASIKADVCRGSANNGGTNCAHHKQTFYGGRMSVTADYARMIDDFFSRYGYAYKGIAIPMRNARPYWTYIKTANCTITASSTNGGLPCDDEKKICEIYDKGITWWRCVEENNTLVAYVGHYEKDNSPTPPSTPSS